MAKFLTTTAIVVALLAPTVAHAAAGDEERRAAAAALAPTHGTTIAEYMAKTSPEEKAVLVSQLVIYEEKCPLKLNATAAAMEKAILAEHAYTIEQVKGNMTTNAAFIGQIGQEAWCAKLEIFSN